MGEKIQKQSMTSTTMQLGGSSSFISTAASSEAHDGDCGCASCSGDGPKSK